MRRLYKEERGVEPTIMKLLVGVVLVSIGLGVGVTMYNEMGEDVSKALNYELTASPSADSVSRGKSTDVSLEIDSLSEFDERVNLSVSGAPDNVDVVFRPSSGDPDFGSTMEITVGANAQTGTHTITVKGRAGDDEKATTFDLTVK